MTLYPSFQEKNVCGLTPCVLLALSRPVSLRVKELSRSAWMTPWKTIIDQNLCILGASTARGHLTVLLFFVVFVLPLPAVYCRMSINGNICRVFPTELGLICGGKVWRRVREEGEWNHNFKCLSQCFFQNNNKRKTNKGGLTTSYFFQFT